MLAPTDVVTRQSTEVVAFNDPALAAAVRYIASHALQRINAGSVSEAAAMSRRTLERRFREVLGRSILDEVQRVRLVHAQQMLVETNQPVPRIAVQCGFRDAQHFWAVFRRHIGQSPSDYRRRHQLGRSDPAGGQRAANPLPHAQTAPA
jgi:LacI family transcriptional regulator